MSSILKPIQRWLAPIESIEPGMYHYISPQDDPRNYRLHLRIENDGAGVLIINASTVLHLNETAAEYAYYFVNNLMADEVAGKMSHRYQVGHDQALQDYHNLTERILTLVETPDLDPVTFLEFDRREPYSGNISAPYRIDCALTYNLPENAPAEAAPHKRVTRELSTAEWQQIIDKAWQVGIPHIIFTGGEPTMRSDLIDLIAHAEKNGQVTGLLTDGLQLREGEYFETLSATGLDHIVIRLVIEDERVWDAISTAMDGDIFVAVHITITEGNRSAISTAINRLAALQVHAISLSASPEIDDTELEAARDMVAEADISLVWDIPVPYSTHNPVSLEISAEHPPEGAGRAWLYIEPDGDVLPDQGQEKVLGNVLEKTWDEIWHAR